MGNKRLKKRAYSLKGLGRRGLSMLMAMVMTLSLVQISAFAEEDVAENQPNPLEPETVKNVNDHGIDLTKTAERVGDTEWEVTVRADIGDTKIKQQPLDVVFVLDKSGSMAWCAEETHDNPHEHSDSCCQLKADADPEHKHSRDEYGILGNFKPWKCPNYELVCGQPYAVSHSDSGGYPCYSYKDEDDLWSWNGGTPCESRLSVAIKAMNKLKDSLPAGTNVSYVVFLIVPMKCPAKSIPT